MPDKPPFLPGGLPVASFHPIQIATAPSKNQTLNPAHHMAAQHNAQLPGLDANAILQNISPEQLAIIAQMISAGQIQLPPTAPRAHNIAPIEQAQASNGNALATQHSRDPPEHVEIDEDTEEGEVEDDVPMGVNQGSGPSTRNADIQRSSRFERQDMNSRKVKRRMTSPPSQPPAQRRAFERRQTPRGTAARSFILEMNRAGYSFEDLAEQIDDTRALQHLFEELGLPASVDSKRSVSSRIDAHQEVAAQQPVSHDRSATLTTVTQLKAPSPTLDSRASSDSKRVVPARGTAAVDRSEYLARLQAAKKKKADPPQSAQPHLSSAKPASPQATQKAGTGPVPKKSMVNTELVKQRLEALKAAQAAKQNALINANNANQVAAASGGTLHVGQSMPAHLSSQPVRDAVHRSPPSSIPLADSGAYRANAVNAPGIPAPSSSVSEGARAYQLPGLSISGSPFQSSMPGFHLPGLGSAADASTTGATFSPSTNGSLSAASEGPTNGAVTTAVASPAPAQPFRKRPVATDLIEAAPPMMTQVKRPFGPTGGDNVIIEVSDGEDSELDDAVDDQMLDAVLPPRSIILPGLNTISDFAKPTSSSATATPGTTTPGGTPYQQKLVEIERMRKRIEDMELKKRHTSGVATPLPSRSDALLAATASTVSTSPKAAELSVGSGEPVNTDMQTNPTAAMNRQQLAEQIQEAERELDHMRHKGSASHTGSDQEQSMDSESEMDLDDSELDSSDDSSDVSHQEEFTASGGSEATPQLDPVASSGPDFVGGLANSANATPDLANGDPPATDEQNSPPDEDLDHAGSDDDVVDASNTSDEESDDYEPEPLPVDGPTEMVPSADSPVMEPESEAETGDANDNVSSNELSGISRDASAIAEDKDIAPELMLSKEEQVSLEKLYVKPTTYYQEYRSPLVHFKDYRFHPDYLQNVAGGFRSLTYSNKIDPQNQLCRYEAMGGRCNDASCDNQHFRSMELTDNELLTELGTKNIPVSNAEDDKRWKLGLGELVKQLRTSNLGKDVNAIADRIAQYRREFVGSPDKIINLNL